MCVCDYIGTVALGQSIAAPHHVQVQAKVSGNELPALLHKVRSLSTESSVSQKIDKIAKFFDEKGDITFCPTGQHAELHDLVCETTLQVRQDDKMKSMWKTFLSSIHQKTAQSPWDCVHTLDFSPELTYLADSTLHPENQKVTTEKLTTQTENLSTIVNQVFACEEDSFGKLGSSRDRITVDPSPYPHSTQWIVARDASTKEVIGSLSYWNHPKTGWTIEMIARKANAAKRKIGRALVQECLQQIPKNVDVFLGVREGNATAIALYEKYGFKKFGKSDHMPYDKPREYEVYMKKFAVSDPVSQPTAKK